MAERGYWIVHMSVTDPGRYEAYRQANAEALEKYGARFLVRGGEFEAVEGEARDRNVVIEFDSYEQALACYHSPEYQRAKALREGAAAGEFLVIRGYEG